MFESRQKCLHNVSNCAFTSDLMASSAHKTGVDRTIPRVCFRAEIKILSFKLKKRDSLRLMLLDV